MVKNKYSRKICENVTLNTLTEDPQIGTTYSYGNGKKILKIVRTIVSMFSHCWDHAEKWLKYWSEKRNIG